MYLMIDNETKINRSDIYSYNLTKNATPSSALALGGCCISAFTISFDKRNYSKFNKNAKVEVFNDKDIKLGEFYVDTPDSSNHIMTLECSDILKKASVKWKGRSFPCTIYELFSNITLQIGIKTLITLEDLPCGSCVVNESKNLKNMTCIDLLSDIAELNGGFFYVNNNGELIFKTFDFDNQKEYDENYIHEVSKIEEVLTTRRGLYIVGANNNGYSFGDSYNQLSITDNEIIKTMTNDGINFVGNTILNKIKYFEYNAAEVSLWQDDKIIELGDVIKVVDIDGNYHSIIVHELSFSNNDNYCNIESYGDNLKTKAIEETSQIENDTTITQDSGEVYMGRGQNHQRVLAKAGTYVLAEELVEEVSSFSKVFLNLFLEFNYDYVENRILFFDIYANDKKVKSLKCKTDQGFNQFSVGFLADVDLESNTNLYSCRVTLLENETIEILEFECQLSFIVKSCKIRDAIATDQRFVEKFEKIDNRIFNQNKFTIKTIREKGVIRMPIYELDISENEDGSIMCTLYQDGTIEIAGSGNTKNKTLYQQFKEKFSENVAKEVVAKTNNVLVVNDEYLHIYGGAFKGFNKTFDEVVFSGSAYVNLCGYTFYECNINSISGENKITTLSKYDFYNSTINCTMDLSNVGIYGDSCLRGVTCPYISLNPRNNFRLGANAFADSNFDSVFVCNTTEIGYFGNEFDFPSSAFKNCHISKFILNESVKTFDCDGNFAPGPGFDYILASPKYIYVDYLHTIDKDKDGSDMFYFLEKDFAWVEYLHGFETILSEVWR